MTHTEVATLIHRYARAIDRLDAALFATLFWPDAAIDMGAIHTGGPDAFAGIALGFMRTFAATRHEVTNVLVLDETPDTARAEAYVRAWHRIDADGGTRELVVLGRYLVTAARRDGAWRLSAFSEVLDWGEERAADPSWADAPGPLPRGARDTTDPSYPPPAR